MGMEMGVLPPVGTGGRSRVAMILNVLCLKIPVILVMINISTLLVSVIPWNLAKYVHVCMCTYVCMCVCVLG